MDRTERRTKDFPKHVAIIMDGNGRWAEKRGLVCLAGHREGVERAREVTEECVKLGIEYLTQFAFSTENWKRPKQEVNGLMGLFERYLSRQLKNMQQKGIRFKVIGDLEDLPLRLQRRIRHVEEATGKGTALVPTVALSYGGRHEILRAAIRLAKEAVRGKLDPESIDECTFRNCLYTQGIPDPDLLIRTGGELRLSNFMLFQSAYTGLYMTSTLWPDFGLPEFYRALKDYARRERRFGMTGPQVRGKSS